MDMKSNGREVTDIEKLKVGHWLLKTYSLSDLQFSWQECYSCVTVDNFVVPEILIDAGCTNTTVLKGSTCPPVKPIHKVPSDILAHLQWKL